MDQENAHRRPNKSPRSLKLGRIQLQTKSLAISYITPPSRSDRSTDLVVFVNNIDTSRRIWHATVKELLLQTPSPIAILLYDRYGYGDSDKPATQKIFNHDIRDSVDDLHEIIALFCTDYLHTSFSPQNMHLTIVAGSIGCMISRLYADKFPRTVSNLLLLDHGPILQDCPIPDPTTTSVTFPEGITAAMLRDARDKYYKGAYFHLAPNRERMSWKCLTEILRRPDTPSLKHPDGLGGPFITVLMHDGPTYAKQLSQKLGYDPKIIETWQEPHWPVNSRLLAGLTTEGRFKGPIIAKNSGHFIALESPKIVADELAKLLDRAGRLQIPSRL